jgi:hypothetical protein
MYSLRKRGSSHTHSTLTEEATMMLKVRRIVTGHDEFGMGIVVSDEKLSAVSRGLGANISGCEIWSTNSMPVDNSMEAEAAQRAGFVKKYNYVGNGQGTTVRIVEWAPGHAMFPHRTETLDYSIVLSGEIDVEFDSGQVVEAGRRDCHARRNPLLEEQRHDTRHHGFHPDRRRSFRGSRREEGRTLSGVKLHLCLREFVRHFPHC